MRKAPVLGVIWLLGACTAGAQSFTGRILGTVKDTSDAVIPQAAITVTNIATNIRTETRADSSGNYVFPQLPPGQYRIEVEAPGFKKFVREGVTLAVEQQARVDILLAVGQVTESVVVSANASLLETATSSVGKVVDNQRILSLPLNTRNVYSLVFLTPGVTGSVGNNYNSLSYNVNGARGGLDTIIDGVTASHPTVNGAAGITVFPSVDAIDEFKLMGANYSAEFGRSLGSVLNVVYKSGGNQIHGSAYEFLRNSVLDANNFYSRGRGVDLPNLKRSQFGGMVSGPVRRDKTFYMVSYEGLRQRGFSSTNPSVPTLLERQGDFSQSLASNGQLIRIFDPFTTRASGSGFIRDPFPDNKVPAFRLDPVAVNVMKYYPLPNFPGITPTNKNNYYRTGATALNTDNYDFRVDHNISTSQRFFARYSHRLTENVPAVFWPEEIKIAEGRQNEENHARNAVADYTNSISPTMILTGRLGFARTLYVLDNQGLGFIPSSLGLPRAIDTAVDRMMFPAFSASGYASLGGGDHRWNPFMTYSALANLTKIRGAHTMKFGFEGRMIRVNVWEARAAGTFSFSNGFTQGPNPNTASSTAGNGLASLLLGTGSGSLLQAWKNVATQSFYTGLYFQDDWRVMSRLTLNLGLRHDMDTPRTERYNRMNYFDPSAPSPLARVVPGFPDLRGGVVFVGVDGRSRHQYPYDKNNFAPRFGFAYQLTPKTVLRGGYGHSFGPSLQAAQGTVGPYGFRTESTWVGSVDGITPLNLLSNPYPQGFTAPPGSSEGLLTQVGSNLEGVLRDQVTPWAMQWNFTIQRELPGEILIETAYVGTRGLQLSRGGEGARNLNQLQPEMMSLGSRLNEQVDNPFFGHVTSGILAQPRVGRAQLLRPFPQFTTVTPLFASGGSSNYHSMQITMKKRFSHGLMFEGSHTWGKIIEDGTSHQDSYNTAASRAIAGDDVAHRFVMSYIYELPFGRGKRFGANAPGMVNLLLGGWQFNGITTFQNGTPLSISASNTAGIGNTTIRANNNGKSGKLEGSVTSRLDRYFDTTVFSQPPAFTFGNLSTRLSDIRSDGIRSFDLSLFKEFSPREWLKTQFRAEFLNAFNTPRFSGPDTSVTSQTFGRINSQANSPRQMQFGLKLLW
jgi:hypothetical protein